LSVSNWYCWVQAIVINLACLSIKHNVGHGVILVSEEVLIDIKTTLVESPVFVCLITLELMSIDSPINEGKNGVFEWNPLLSLRVDIEGHVVVTLDVHKVIV
jgi:hypothetical protein